MPSRLSMEPGPCLEVVVGNLQRVSILLSLRDNVIKALTVSGLQSVGQNTDVLSSESSGRSRESANGFVRAMRANSLMPMMDKAMSLSWLR